MSTSRMISASGLIATTPAPTISSPFAWLDTGF